MVIGRTPDGRYATADIDLNYDLNVKGLHHVLHVAAEAGIKRAVATKHHVGALRLARGMVADEDTPCDARDLYGFTKGLASRCAPTSPAVRGMTVVALRLNGPVSVEDWQQELPARLPQRPHGCSRRGQFHRPGADRAAGGIPRPVDLGGLRSAAHQLRQGKAGSRWEPRERPR